MPIDINTWFPVTAPNNTWPFLMKYRELCAADVTLAPQRSLLNELNKHDAYQHGYYALLHLAKIRCRGCGGFGHTLAKCPSIAQVRKMCATNTVTRTAHARAVH